MQTVLMFPTSSPLLLERRWGECSLARPGFFSHAVGSCMNGGVKTFYRGRFSCTPDKPTVRASFRISLHVLFYPLRDDYLPFAGVPESGSPVVVHEEPLNETVCPSRYLSPGLLVSIGTLLLPVPAFLPLPCQQLRDITPYNSQCLVLLASSGG